MRSSFQYIIAFLAILLVFSCFSQAQKSMQNIKGTEGYFRIGKSTQGQWWFLDPENKPFYYRGVCAVNRAGAAGGRNAKPKKYAITVDKKYDYLTSPDSFVNACINKMNSLGFNALGAWATEEFYNKGLPFTEILEFFKEPPFLPSLTNKEGLPDIFHPDWLVAIDRKARALCSPLRTSKQLIGYFTDNEIGFGKADDFGLDLGFNAGQFDFSLLRQILGMKTGEPSFEIAWDFILKRHDNSFEKLSDAWMVKISKKEDIKQLNDSKTSFPGKEFNEDAKAFVKLYADRYFELAYKTIRRYDPNHLVLGCRFGAPPPTDILDAIMPWTDVISANNYQPILYERYDTIYKYSGLPLLIGEFSWNTDLYKKVPFQDESTQSLSVKERMFKRGKATLERMALHDGIVGYTWYRWVQGTCTDEKFFDGVVNYDDSLEMHSTELKKVNTEMESLRLNASSQRWESTPIADGEMTLFFDQLRPEWTQYLRVSFQGGNPQGAAIGWNMNGIISKYILKKNNLSMKLELTFADASAYNKVFEAGKGIYEISVNRSGEKFYGTFKGNYKGKAISGKVKAFYFPNITH